MIHKGKQDSSGIVCGAIPTSLYPFEAGSKYPLITKSNWCYGGYAISCPMCLTLDPE